MLINRKVELNRNKSLAAAKTVNNILKYSQNSSRVYCVYYTRCKIHGAWLATYVFRSRIAVAWKWRSPKYSVSYYYYYNEWMVLENIFFIETPLLFFTRLIGHCIYYTNYTEFSFESSYILINRLTSYLFYVHKKKSLYFYSN